MLAGPYGLHGRGLRTGERMRCKLRMRKRSCRGEVEEWPSLNGHRRPGHTKGLSKRRVVEGHRQLCLDALISRRCEFSVCTRGIGTRAQLLLYQDRYGLSEDV